MKSYILKHTAVKRRAKEIYGVKGTLSLFNSESRYHKEKVN